MQSSWPQSRIPRFKSKQARGRFLKSVSQAAAANIVEEDHELLANLAGFKDEEASEDEPELYAAGLDDNDEDEADESGSEDEGAHAFAAMSLDKLMLNW